MRLGVQFGKFCQVASRLWGIVFGICGVESDRPEEYTHSSREEPQL